MLRIRQNNLKNIYQLAKDLGRKYEAVYRDIKLLEGFGIISLKSENKKKIPYILEEVNILGFAAG